MSDGRNKTTDQTHCDKCKKRVYDTLWESRYYWSGVVCTPCYDELMREVRRKNGDFWCDFLPSSYNGSTHVS